MKRRHTYSEILEALPEDNAALARYRAMVLPEPKYPEEIALNEIILESARHFRGGPSWWSISAEGTLGALLRVDAPARLDLMREALSQASNDVEVPLFRLTRLAEDGSGREDLVEYGYRDELHERMQAAAGNARLILRDGKDREIGWSRDLEGQRRAPAPVYLESCHTVAMLLEAAHAAAMELPEGPARAKLQATLKPFESGVAAAFYNREEMREQVPPDLEDKVDDATLDAALARLVRDFQHPRDSMSSLVRCAHHEANASRATRERG